MNDATGMPQTAVVVGGTSDIARAVVRALVARRLRRIVLAGRDEIGLAAAAKELQALGAAEVDTVTLDVTDVTQIPVAVRDATTRLGQVDMVLVAAGVLGEQARDEVDPDAVARVVTTNLTGPAAVITAFAAVLRNQGHGRIVVLSSVAGVRVRRANYVYGASKAGLDAFAQGTAESLRGSGASLMIVRPGWVATRMTEGRDPAPLATTPDAVAADVVAGMERSAPVVWSPGRLRLVFAVLRFLPAALWRRLPG
jgi:decaprenylphospho-beta-D-erythro-pentofuranosid-2-ulose 2-reductase